MNNSTATYDNDASQFGRDRYTLVNHPLRTKIPPSQLIRSEAKSVEMDSFLKSQSTTTQKPEDTLLEMKELLKIRQRGNVYASGNSPQVKSNLPNIKR